MDFDRYAPRFLLWVADRSDGVPAAPSAPVDCAEFRAWQQMEPAALQALVDHLAGLGFLSRYEGYGSGGGPLVQLEPPGAEQARRMRRRREDETERARYAQDALLEWLRVHPGQPPYLLSAFFDSPQVFFLGTALTEAEVEEAAGYLAGVGLVERGVYDRARIALTDDGRDFVWSSSRLDEYVREWREREHAPAQTVVQVTYSVQMGPAELGLLVQRLAPDLELDRDSLAELLRLSGELADQSRGDDPGTPDTQGRPPHSGGVLGRVRELVGSASGGAVKSLLEDVVTQAVTRGLGM
ncbi:hypothetical protein [Streptomyces boncukensis]|uniref:Uncharacterized protein n=1 Tax=Streptomyces boncukensis TaxID=2711219 RepID=A0A6G4WRT6_9ACTN|nr:hypothetical protein [Streptomyces boncukensis]NGO67989.1 hypothetical protein [Streptomyces boncukensis]